MSLHSLYWIFRRLMRTKAHARLAQAKGIEELVYNRLSQDFRAKYALLAKHDISRFTSPIWDSYNAALEKVFLPVPPIGFLNDRVVTETMFVTAGGNWLNEELPILRKRRPKR